MGETRLGLFAVVAGGDAVGHPRLCGHHLRHDVRIALGDSPDAVLTAAQAMRIAMIIGIAARRWPLRRSPDRPHFAVGGRGACGAPRASKNSPTRML